MFDSYIQLVNSKQNFFGGSKIGLICPMVLLAIRAGKFSWFVFQPPWSLLNGTAEGHRSNFETCSQEAIVFSPEHSKHSNRLLATFVRILTASTTETSPMLSMQTSLTILSTFLAEIFASPSSSASSTLQIFYIHSTCFSSHFQIS